MITLGIDAHKRSHTVVAVDELGRHMATRTTTETATADHLELLRWAEALDGGDERDWAVEDCRHLSRRLESDLRAAGERIKRVPPKLTAQARDSARTYGKSDPIDALAVARAALRHPDLPVAQLDGPARELRLLVDHRQDRVFTRHNGTAPLPVWSSNRPRHRLARTGNRQLNAAIHRIAVTQGRGHPDARADLERRAAVGTNPKEARRALKRHRSDIVFRALPEDANTASTTTLAAAA